MSGQRALSIGVVASYREGFDGWRVIDAFTNAIKSILKDHPKATSRCLTIVSSPVDIGPIGIVHKMVDLRGWLTVGVACATDIEFSCFDTGERIIAGKNPGEELEAFLQRCDVLIHLCGDDGDELSNKAVKQFELLKTGKTYTYHIK
jgi:hypothetical protein